MLEEIETYCLSPMLQNILQKLLETIRKDYNLMDLVSAYECEAYLCVALSLLTGSIEKATLSSKISVEVIIALQNFLKC
jgi:hypothetical protein